MRPAGGPSTSSTPRARSSRARRPELIAFWELHDDRMTSFDPAISLGLGLEPWVNHIAFNARDLDDIESRKKRWLDHGHDVVEIDHGFCVSIYTLDPSRILVEFCTDTRPYTAEDKAHAKALLSQTDPDSRPTEPGVPRSPRGAREGPRWRGAGGGGSAGPHREGRPEVSASAARRPHRSS